MYLQVDIFPTFSSGPEAGQNLVNKQGVVLEVKRECSSHGRICVNVSRQQQRTNTQVLSQNRVNRVRVRKIVHWVIVAHALNTVNLGSILGTTYDPASPPEVIPEYRSRSKS